MKKMSTHKDPKLGGHKKKRVPLGKACFTNKTLTIYNTQSISNYPDQSTNQVNRPFLEPTVRAVKTRIECRGQKEPRNPRQWLEINPEGKVQATENQKSDSTLFYLVPIGLRK